MWGKNDKVKNQLHTGIFCGQAVESAPEEVKYIGSCFKRLCKYVDKLEHDEKMDKQQKNDILDFIRDTLVKELQVLYCYLAFFGDGGAHYMTVNKEWQCRREVLGINDTNFIFCPWCSNRFCGILSGKDEPMYSGCSGEYYPELGFCAITNKNHSTLHALLTNDIICSVKVVTYSFAHQYARIGVDKNGRWYMIQQNDIQQNDAQRNNTQRNNTQQKDRKDDTDNETWPSNDPRIALLYKIARMQKRDCRTK